MAILSEVSVNFGFTPRIITVDNSLLSISVQDLLDSIRNIEASSLAMDNAHLINAAGKETLGSGVSVAITAELQNAQLMFKSRTINEGVGTVTTGDSNGEILIDSNADFITSGVEVGAEVINFTDRSVGVVLEVTSATQIITCPLGDGTDNQWEIGDDYKIWNQHLCEVSGGNLVAVDDSATPMQAILPSFGTYVAKSSASSATLVSGDGDLTNDSIAAAVWAKSEALIVRKMLENKVTKSGDVITIYEDNGTTVWRQYNLANGERIQV